MDPLNYKPMSSRDCQHDFKCLPVYLRSDGYRQAQRLFVDYYLRLAFEPLEQMWYSLEPVENFRGQNHKHPQDRHLLV